MIEEQSTLEFKDTKLQDLFIEIEEETSDHYAHGTSYKITMSIKQPGMYELKGRHWDGYDHPDHWRVVQPFNWDDAVAIYEKFMGRITWDSSALIEKYYKEINYYVKRVILDTNYLFEAEKNVFKLYKNPVSPLNKGDYIISVEEKSHEEAINFSKSLEKLLNIMHNTYKEEFKNKINKMLKDV